mgnify:CR=1 FL=1
MRMKQILSGCLLVVGIALWSFLLGHVWAIEQLDLTTPIQPPSTTYYRVIGFHWNKPTGDISATVVDNRNTVSACTYTGAEGVGLIGILNTANGSVKSLEKRILEKCSADGKLGAGTLSGSP